MRRWAIASVVALVALPSLVACGEERVEGALSEATVSASATVSPTTAIASPTAAESATTSPASVSASPPVATSAAGMTASEFFDRIGAAIEGGDGVLHTRVEYTSYSEGQDVLLWTDETWIDAEQDVARREFQRAPGVDLDVAEKLTDILGGDVIYSMAAGDDEVWTNEARTECAEIETHALTAFLVCGLYPFQPSEPELSVELDTAYEDQPAVALFYEMVAEPNRAPPAGSGPTPEPQSERVEARLYIERETSLPLAWVVDWNSVEGETLGSQVARFETERVARESLPTDFFDPASIGYSDDPMASIDRAELDIPVLWLSEEFDPEGELPPIRLQYAEPQKRGEGGDWASVGMQYSSTDYPDAAVVADTFVDLLLWTPDAWQRFYADFPEWMPSKSICAERREVSVEGGSAVIILTHEMEPYEQQQLPQPQSTAQPMPTPVEPTPVVERSDCPDEPYDRFAAIITFDDVVVTVNILDCLYCGPRQYEADAYDTVAGMEAIVSSLRRR